MFSSKALWILNCDNFWRCEFTESVRKCWLTYFWGFNIEMSSHIRVIKNHKQTFWRLLDFSWKYWIWWLILHTCMVWSSVLSNTWDLEWCELETRLVTTHWCAALYWCDCYTSCQQLPQNVCDKHVSLSSYIRYPYRYYVDDIFLEVKYDK